MEEDDLVVRQPNEPGLENYGAVVPPFDEEGSDENIADASLYNNSNDMDVADEASEGHNEAPSVVVKITVDRPGVDLERLAGSFKVEALCPRLFFIADVCPPLRAEALKMLIDKVVANSQNVAAYALAYQKVDHYKSQGALPNADIIPAMDNTWLDATNAHAQSRLDMLCSEFRRQKDDGVKESIRRAMHDVFHQHLSMGNVTDALKLYSRGIREYCTAPNYLIQMLLSWICASVYAEQWPKLSVLIPQAERAVAEALDREGGSGQQQQQNRPPRQPQTKNMRDFIAGSKAKLNAVSGLAAMKSQSYKSAADKFISVELDALDYPELISSNDIAACGTICALASYSRKELKEKVLASSSFRKFLESEPHLVDLLQKFCTNQFGASLDVLNSIKDHLLLNVYLAPHIPDLYSLIRRRAIVQYFEPYLTADLHKMAVEFRTTVEDLELELVELIRSKMLNARIDNLNKVLQVNTIDKRREVFERTLKATEDMEATIRSILIRAALHQQGVFVGLSECSQRRRNREMMDELESGRSEQPSTSNRMIATVQRFFNAASNRIHPQNDGHNDTDDNDENQV